MGGYVFIASNGKWVVRPHTHTHTNTTPICLCVIVWNYTTSKPDVLGDINTIADGIYVATMYNGFRRIPGRIFIFTVCLGVG